MGRPSAFKGKKHTEHAKQLIGFSKTGEMGSKKEREEAKANHTKEWIASHPERVKFYDKKYLRSRAVSNSIRRRQFRHDAIIKLGGRCVSPNCKWVNEDGTSGCTDFRILQFDHVKGKGTKDRKKRGFEKLCKAVLKDNKGEFQLLCSNCNWIKAFENREFIFKYDLEDKK